MPALDDSALRQLFTEARSRFHFTDQGVPQTQLEAIWDLVKFGPTSANLLPARLIWLTTQRAKDRLVALASDGNKDKIRDAPVTAIVGMDMEFYELAPELFPIADAKSWFVGNEQSISATAFRNSSLQGGYLIMAIRALGLDAYAMSGFDNAGVDAEFFAGTSIKSNFICSLGYGDRTKDFPRLPRPDFDRFNTVL